MRHGNGLSAVGSENLHLEAARADGVVEAPAERVEAFDHAAGCEASQRAPERHPITLNRGVAREAPADRDQERQRRCGDERPLGEAEGPSGRRLHTGISCLPCEAVDLGSHPFGGILVDGGRSLQVLAGRLRHRVECSAQLRHVGDESAQLRVRGQTLVQLVALE